jgi:hypothetical protein
MLGFGMAMPVACGVGLMLWLGSRLAVRAAAAAGLGAGAQRLVDDLLDGTGAAAAFGTAAEAAIDLSRGTRQGVRRRYHRADIVIAQDVAGTNNHETSQPARVAAVTDIEDAGGMQKEKPAF